MLTKLGQRAYAVREAFGDYRVSQFDTDTDTDTDTDPDTDTDTDTDPNPDTDTDTDGLGWSDAASKFDSSTSILRHQAI
jgi:DNA-binding beta-propeller fold protein YncE